LNRVGFGVGTFNLGWHERREVFFNLALDAGRDREAYAMLRRFEKVSRRLMEGGEAGRGLKRV